MKRSFIIITASVLFLGTVLADISREERLDNLRESELSTVRVEPPPLSRPMSVSVPYFDDFESGAGGWTQIPLTTYCQWQIVTDPELIEVHPDIYGDMVVLGDPSPASLPSARSGRNCWWYGNPENGTFIGEPFDHFSGLHSGGESYEDHGGYLTSPLFETSALSSITFSFWTWWEVECIDINQFDMMIIQASSDAGATWETLNWLNPPFSRLPGWDEWEGYSSGGWLEPGIWIRWTYFLEPEWTGHDIMVRFEFDTRDMLYNGFRGWMIDDFYISGGIEEPHLFREGEHPESLSVVDCDIFPNPFPFTFTVTNEGGEAASDVVLQLVPSSAVDISTGFEIVTIGTMLPDDEVITNWQLNITEPPLYDTSLCWEVLLTSADSLIGYSEDFEGEDPLFIGDGGMDYSDVRRPGGPSDAVSGLGVASIPSSGSEFYGAFENAHLTSESFDITGWTEAYISFWYWLDVTYDPLWDTDGEDGFLVEYQADGGPWEQLDVFGVGILLPRYDAYIDEFSMSAIANRMAYCKPTEGRWVEVVSQDLIDMGILTATDDVRFRFVFASDGAGHGEGLFIDDFRLSTHQYPVGPYLHTFCIDVPGLRIPYAELVMPLDSTSSSCPDQSLVINAGGEAYIDANGVVIWADGETRFAVAEGNMTVDVDAGVIIAQPSGSQLWAEGWHNLALDTCLNVYGCNLDSAIHWSFLSDLTPPDVELIDPPGGMFFNDPLGAVTVSIEDTLTGVDSATIEVIFCGTAYSLPHPSLVWNGIELTFYPESTGTGQTWIDCGDICIVAGDSPDYCPPNTDTTCFDIIVDFSFPWAELVAPPTGAVSACGFQEINIALFDSNGIDPFGAEFLVNGIRHVSGIGSELVIEDDTLKYRPFNQWIHGDTVEFALELFYNLNGIANRDTLESYFVADIAPPVVTPLSPQPWELMHATDVHIEGGLEDYPAGLNNSTIELVFMGRTFEHEEIGWTGSDYDANFSLNPSAYGLVPTWGDTFDIEVRICDAPDLCEANCTSFVWSFHMEPQTVCAAFPNPFTPNSDGINDAVMFDYPHRFIEGANLKIFNIDNNLIFESDIESGNRLWDGIDDTGKSVSPGLYIYIIEGGGRILCNGTVVLLR